MRHILLNYPEQRYFDSLPPQVVADLFERDVSGADFVRIWGKRENHLLICLFG
jgi:hypothetical protein